MELLIQKENPAIESNIGISLGQPSLLFSFGSEVTPVTLFGVKLNDGLWHDLTVSRK